MEAASKIELLVNDLKEYANNRIDLVKLKATEKGTGMITSIVAAVALTVIGFLFLIFLSIGGAMALSEAIGNTYSGYFIVSGVYLVIGILCWASKDKWIKTPVSNAIIKKIFKEEAE